MTDKELVLKFFETLEARDRAGLEAMMAPDFKEMAQGYEDKGKEGFFAHNEDFFTYPEDAKHKIVEMFADGQGQVFAYTKIKSGGQTVVRTAETFKIENGLIAAHWSVRQIYAE